MMLVNKTQNVCEVENCEHPSLARNLCKNHYQRFRRTGDVGSGYVKSSDEYPKVCSVANCGKNCRGLGYCNAHYLKFRKYGNPNTTKPRGFFGSHTSESKSKMSLTRKGQFAGDKHPMWGKTHSRTTKQKMSAARIGVKLGPQPQKYSLNPGYQAIHIWMRRGFSKIGTCEACGLSRETYWSNISGDYRRDRNDFWELCVPCHKLFDYILRIERADPNVISILRAKRCSAMKHRDVSE